jgi:hypothetical protein
MTRDRTELLSSHAGTAARPSHWARLTGTKSTDARNPDERGTRP